MSISKRKPIIYIVVGLALIASLSWLTITNASNRKDLAAESAHSSVVELLKDNEPLVEDTSDLCSHHESWIEKLLKHRDCVAIDTVFYSSSDSTGLMEQLYSEATSSGWLVLDSGRVNEFGFDEAKYLEAIINRGNDKGNVTESSLTIRIIGQEGIDSLSNQFDESEIQTLRSSGGQIVQIYVSTRYEG